MCLEKWKTVMKAFAASQFGYFSLVWMFHSNWSFFKMIMRVSVVLEASKKKLNLTGAYKNSETLFFTEKKGSLPINCSSNNIFDIFQQLDPNKAHSYEIRSIKMLKICKKSICRP